MISEITDLQDKGHTRSATDLRRTECDCYNSSYGILGEVVGLSLQFLNRLPISDLSRLRMPVSRGYFAG
jgi:hypothetical protein